MTIDDVQELVEPTPGLQERVAKRPRPYGIDLTTQHLGNRVRRTFYPEHWAQVQIARDNARRYATG
ncbi:MAG: hypothetical protein ACO3G4_14460 [Opitutaceae bacterium]